MSTVGNAIVVDERIRESNDLSAVGRIGADFLVAGHAGVEAQFSRGIQGGTKGSAEEDVAVFQGEKGLRMGLEAGTSIEHLSFHSRQRMDELAVDERHCPPVPAISILR